VRVFSRFLLAGPAGEALFDMQPMALFDLEKEVVHEPKWAPRKLT
jgi:hypothetical protein